MLGLALTLRRAVVLVAVSMTLACASAPPSKNVHFDTGKHEPNAPEEYLAIGRVAEAMVRDPKLRLLVVGHTDSIGSDEKNRELALRRAERVRELVMEQDGTIDSRMRIAYHGAAKPIASNDTDEGRALNRRVELFFYRPKLGQTDTAYLQAQFGGKLEFSASAEVSLE